MESKRHYHLLLAREKAHLLPEEASAPGTERWSLHRQPAQTPQRGGQDWVLARPRVSLVLSLTCLSLQVCMVVSGRSLGGAAAGVEEAVTSRRAQRAGCVSPSSHHVTAGSFGVWVECVGSPSVPDCPTWVLPGAPWLRGAFVLTGVALLRSDSHC